MVTFFSWLFFSFAAAGSIALRYPHLLHLAMPYWLFSWVGQTFALPLAILTGILCAVHIAYAPPYSFTLLLCLLTIVLLLRLHLYSYKTGKALFAAVVGQQQADQLVVPKTTGLLPIRTRLTGVKRISNIAYGEHGKRNVLDIFIPEQASDKPLPIVIQIHGGAWITGNKDGQGQPLMNHLAKHGWMGVAINYRLAPKDPFPAMLVDVFSAISWLKKNAAQYGGDASFIALTGGSAGGHLSALATLCFNQPGFADNFDASDIHIDAAVPLYGRYDFLDPAGYMGRGHDSVMTFMRNKVMQLAPEDDNTALEQASPVNHLHDKSPPMLVIHGKFDSLLPYEEARDFVQIANQKNINQIKFHLLDGAQHSFDIFNTPATYYLTHTITAYLNQQRALHEDNSTQ